MSTYADIEHMLKVVGPQTGTRFEAEAYDVSHLYTLAYYLDKGLVEPPIFIQTIFGTMGGIGPDVDHIVHMKRTADRLLGDAYQWSTLGAGRYQMGIVTAAAIMGSHVRVGLEDSLYLGKGQLAESNADQVAKIRGILEELSLEIATPGRGASSSSASRAWTTSDTERPKRHAPMTPARARGDHRRHLRQRRQPAGGRAVPGPRRCTQADRPAPARLPRAGAEPRHCHRAARLRLELAGIPLPRLLGQRWPL